MATANQKEQVTPAMIAAGVEELYTHPVIEPDDEVFAVAVTQVFLRMLEVQQQSDSGEISVD